jgi:hypothetical protein
MSRMKVYKCEVPVHATAYVKARDRRSAMRKLRSKLEGQILEVEVTEGYVEVSGAPYDSPDLPELSLTPAMTIGKAEYETLSQVE